MLTKDQIDAIKTAKVEAAIVRIMKSKKIAPFNEISAEVRKVLQDFFTMPDIMLRKMIENLIKHEYLERDENQMNTFKYKS